MKYPVIAVILLALTGCDSGTSSTQDAGIHGEPVTTNHDNRSLDLDNPVTGKVSQRGLYRLVRSGGVVESPKTSTGKGVSKPVIELVRSTDQIPLIEGARMYLQYRLWSFPDRPAWVDLRRVLKHPEMTLPDGTKSTGSDYTIKRKVSSKQVIAYTGYGFDEDYEMVEGDWEFEIWHGNNKLVEQKFTTYWPGEEEVAEIKPILELGNGVLGQADSGENDNARRSWPRVIVDDNGADMPAGVAGAKLEMDKYLRAEKELSDVGNAE